MTEWKPIMNAPFDEYVMARNREFGPYKYRVSDFQFIDPPPEEYITMNEYNEVSK